jgi:hypothetical protein
MNSRNSNSKTILWLGLIFTVLGLALPFLSPIGSIGSILWLLGLIMVPFSLFRLSEEKNDPQYRIYGIIFIVCAFVFGIGFIYLSLS